MFKQGLNPKLPQNDGGMMIRIRLLSDACQVVRPVGICLVALTVLACAMAIKGWHAGTITLGVMLISICGIVIYQVHRAVGHLNDRSSAIEAASLDAQRHYMDVLGRIVQFAESRDRHISGHSERVGILSEKIALKMGMDSDRAGRLQLAGRLHDVGLLAIPARLLGERARISLEGFRCIRQHASIGHEVLAPLKGLDDVLGAVKHHHERMNGTGYPDGLAGEDIPIEARILAVADSYDAMTHDRPHRPAVTKSAAMDELRRCSPAGYDSRCVDALASVECVSSKSPASEQTRACVSQAG